MITKNASDILRKVAEDKPVYGFAPGTISHNVFRDLNSDAPEDHEIFTYKPFAQVANNRSILRKLLNTPDKQYTYTYTKSNMPFYANAVKHRNDLNNMINSGTFDTDATANWLTDDPNYANMRREHYASIPEADWNKVFKPMDPAIRAKMDNVKASVVSDSILGGIFGGAMYFDPFWQKGTVRMHDGTLDLGKTLAGADKSASHWSGNMLFPYIIDPHVIAQHEGIHTEQNAKDILNAPWVNKKRAQIINAGASHKLPDADTYALLPMETRQATASANRSIYALSRMLNNANLDDEQWKQFDKNKLMYVRDNFKELPKSREEFIQRMQWLSDNPEIALLLGEGARGVSYRKELEMMNEGHRRKTGQLDAEWTPNAAPPGEAQKALDDYDNGWFLSNNTTNKPKMSAYGLGTVVPA